LRLESVSWRALLWRALLWRALLWSVIDTDYCSDDYYPYLSLKNQIDKKESAKYACM